MLVLCGEKYILSHCHHIRLTTVRVFGVTCFVFERFSVHISAEGPANLTYVCGKRFSPCSQIPEPDLKICHCHFQIYVSSSIYPARLLRQYKNRQRNINGE